MVNPPKQSASEKDPRGPFQISFNFWLEICPRTPFLSFFFFFFLSLALNEVVILQRFKSFFFPSYCGFLFIIDLLRYGVFHLFVTTLYLCGRRRFRHTKRIRSIEDIIL